MLVVFVLVALYMLGLADRVYYYMEAATCIGGGGSRTSSSSSMTSGAENQFRPRFNELRTYRLIGVYYRMKCGIFGVDEGGGLFWVFFSMKVEANGDSVGEKVDGSQGVKGSGLRELRFWRGR
ncbi:hypothetical protein PVK06_002058 [Gossypium arboreum]|uniref:Secreted protein n=1 Tax=Gossypium arboreum TaxID=29729 RepID=A0ABR0R410_GOSAR|nr:hypothetical protein PVK06_002058 [Gossypium arboreum]